MRSFWPFLLIVVPLMEISVFVVVGGQIGVLATILIVLTTATIGMALLRHQGLSVLSRVQRQMQSGDLPGRDLVHGAILLVAGILLLTPGFITDTIGFLLFVPGIRDRLYEQLKSRVTIHAAGFSGGGYADGGYSHNTSGGGGPVIDAEIEEDGPLPGDDEARPDGPSPWRRSGR